MSCLCCFRNSRFVCCFCAFVFSFMVRLCAVDCLASRSSQTRCYCVVWDVKVSLPCLTIFIQNPVHCALLVRKYATRWLLSFFSSPTISHGLYVGRISIDVARLKLPDVRLIGLTGTLLPLIGCITLSAWLRSVLVMAFTASRARLDV